MVGIDTPWVGAHPSSILRKGSVTKALANMLGQDVLFGGGFDCRTAIHGVTDADKSNVQLLKVCACSV